MSIPPARRHGSSRRHPQAAAPAARGPRRCDHCDQAPANPLEQILMSAQWLLPGPHGPTLARYCRRCAPTGPTITDLTCTRCGDGPLLLGALATDPTTGALPDPTRQWLTTAGWQLEQPICPTCLPNHPGPAPPRTRAHHRYGPGRSRPR